MRLRSVIDRIAVVSVVLVIDMALSRRLILWVAATWIGLSRLWMQLYGMLEEIEVQLSTAS
jgi:hypothetical protein